MFTACPREDDRIAAVPMNSGCRPSSFDQDCKNTTRLQNGPTLDKLVRVITKRQSIQDF
jgi:hypothetical protein